MGEASIRVKFGPLMVVYNKFSDYLIITTPSQILHLENKEELDALLQLAVWLRDQRNPPAT